jgi:CHASE2 domain-containing sensor protein
MARDEALRKAIQAYRDEDEDWEELTPVVTQAVHAAMDSRPDSDVPVSGFAVAWGSAKGSAHGRVAWLVAILLAVVALAWLTTRTRSPTPAPVIPSPAARAS